MQRHPVPHRRRRRGRHRLVPRGLRCGGGDAHDRGAGRIAHAELRIGASSIFIGDEHVHYEGIHAPPRVGGTPVYLDLETDDVAAPSSAPSPPAPRRSASRPIPRCRCSRRRSATPSATSG